MASGLQDSYITAIDHAKEMYGVEYQANAISALLEGNFKKKVSDSIQLIVLFILLLLASIVFYGVKTKFSFIPWLLLAFGWIAMCKLLYEQGFILHVVYVPLGVTYTTCNIKPCPYNNLHSATHPKTSKSHGIKENFVFTP